MNEQGLHTDAAPRQFRHRKQGVAADNFLSKMVEGTFGSDGELKKTGPSDLKVAEGLGGSNIKGVDDAKTKKDAEKDTGKEVSDEHINTSSIYPRVGTDPAST